MKKLLIPILVLGWLPAIRAQESTPVNQPEKDAILYMREEEKLARDVYNFLYEKWDANPFENIRKSEQTHMDRMKLLIDTYGLQDPVAATDDKQGVFKNNFLQQQYNELTASGSRSLADALKAGAKIEELDIADLDARIKQSRRPDIISTYEYLKMASENHLRAFVRRLERMGINYTPVLLDKNAYDKIVAGTGNRAGRGRGMGRNGWN